MNQELSSMLSIIIPIDLRFRSSDIMEKAFLFSKKAEEHNVKVIFGLSLLHSDDNDYFMQKLKCFSNVEIVLSSIYTPNVNASMLRNLAFEKCKTKYIALLDVDIYPDFIVIEKYLKLLNENRRPFYILPCLYLTRFATLSLIKGEVDVDTLKDRYFSFSRKEFLHLASPSSLTIMHAVDYSKVNGFDIEFEGHGYEDFDFLMRLSELHDLLGDASDLMIDKTYRSPLFCVGFRKHLGAFCINSLIEKDFVFHLFHPKDILSEYHKLREKNRILFMRKNSRFKRTNARQEHLLSYFIDYCIEHGVDISEYSILFENKPGHIDRYETFRKRINFLFNR